MKVIELDIDKSSKPYLLAEELKQQNPQDGDKIIFISQVLIEKELILIVAILLLDYFKERHIHYANGIIEDILGNKDIVEIENNIKDRYGIEIEMTSKSVNDEDKEWKKISQGNMLRAYGADEPEYDMSMIIEPNPFYKNESR